MNYAALEEFLSIFSVIPQSQVRTPHVFVGTFLHTAQQLIPVVHQDIALLVGAGLRPDMLQRYALVVDALETAESFLNKTRFISEESHLQWEFRAPQVYNYLEEFEAVYQLAYRHKPSIKAQVDLLLKSRSTKGGVQELLGLIQLGLANREPLAAIAFDISKLEKATSLSNDLSVLYQHHIKHDAKSEAALDMRNRAFTYLYTLVKDIRLTGEYLFWNQPQRSAQYTIVYHTSQIPSPTSVQQAAQQPVQQSAQVQVPGAPRAPLQEVDLELGVSETRISSNLNSVLNRKERGTQLSKPQPLPHDPNRRKNRFMVDTDDTGMLEQEKF